MKNKIVVFGCVDSIYTKMVCYYLNKNRINYDLIGQSTDALKNKKENFFFRLKRLLNSGAFKGLSFFSPFVLYLLFEKYKAKKNYKIRRVYEKYKSVNIEADFIVENINSESCLRILQNNSYDYALFGGVGIVGKPIINSINKFCINAHPAPLPECRGGGALECTLYKKLQPGVSVHIATPGIDEGKIIKRSELEIKCKNDFDFQYISTKLTEKCAIELANVARQLLDNIDIQYAENDGHLNYWKDWNTIKQIKARLQLKRIRRAFEKSLF